MTFISTGDAMQDPEPTNLENVLDRIVEVTDRDRVSIEMVLNAVGRRSFGPILLLTGLVISAPLVGDIPGVPTLMGVIVVLTAGQMLFGRSSFWLPRTLLKRSAARDKVQRAVSWLRRPARWLDRIVRPRLPLFVHGPAVYVIAVLCIAIAAATPAMELVPFSANGAGLALVVFGLALTGHDGLLALVAAAITLGTFWVVFSTLL